MSPTPPRADMPDVAPACSKEVARQAASPEVRSAFNWLRTAGAATGANGRWRWRGLRRLRLARRHAGVAGGALSRKSGWMMFALTMWVTCLGSILDLGSGTCSERAASTQGISGEYAVEYPAAGKPLYGPGFPTNGAGVTAMLAIASLLRAVRVRHSLPFVFIGNVGEEGEGDPLAWHAAYFFHAALEGFDLLIAGARRRGGGTRLWRRLWAAGGLK